MNESKIAVLCSICKKPAKAGKAMCLIVFRLFHKVAFHMRRKTQKYYIMQKYIIRMAHEMLVYDSIL